MTPLLSASLLVFTSGFAALAYQSVWLRSFRLLFGASTSASAAVLALFMAGLGLGGLFFGRRAEASRNPLRLYALLELAITAAACASPWLLEVARLSYYSLGGSEALGPGASVAVRLGLAAVVIGAPTFLMGGTLPAMAKAVASSGDDGRRSLGTVYGANTIGAVLGVLVTGFLVFEALGVRGTLFAAAGLNLLAALVALRLSAGMQTPVPAPTQAVGAPPGQAPSLLILPLAACAGFAFLAMELVWYRMLGPLLGGSTYSFGLILAVALLGIGSGSLLYGRGAATRRPSLADLATTCALEATLIGVPLWLGDDFARFALGLQPLARLGFSNSVAVWTVIAALAVLPAAIVSGYQFPQIAALLGRGSEGVARQLGAVTLWNTAGAIAGSLGAGFLLLPHLGAVTLWRVIVGVLAGMALFCVLADSKTSEPHSPGSSAPERTRSPRLVACLFVLLACVTATGEGPTAFWRHSPIGFGRAELAHGPLAMERAERAARFAPLWEVDGLESSVAVSRTTGQAFYVNGKSDGHVRMDACTQVMSGLLGALLVETPRTALVVGLGTGSTAGWLAAVPQIERVNVAELEPAILQVARDAALANLDVLDQPKVRLSITDGRELLLSSHERWDIVFSEPSNPYRAGIASLFSRDFYEGVVDHMNPGGVFVQWLQTYEIDAGTVRTVLTTLGSVFPYIETWRGCSGDLLLAASLEPIRHDVTRMETRAAAEPYRTALARTWGVSGAAGVYSAFVAQDAFVRAVMALPGSDEHISSDDWPILEFGFARGLGRRDFDVRDVFEAARTAGATALPVAIDSAAVEEQRSARLAAIGQRDTAVAGEGESLLRRRARAAWTAGDVENAGRSWAAQTSPPIAPVDLLVAGEGLASIGDARATAVAAALEVAGQRAEAHLVRGRLAVQRGEVTAAADEYAAAFVSARSDPWIALDMLQRAIPIASRLECAAPRARALWEALSTPFAVHLADEARLVARVRLSHRVDFRATCVETFAALEPWPPFSRALLADRLDCYRAHGSALSELAERDLLRFDDLDSATLLPLQRPPR